MRGLQSPEWRKVSMFYLEGLELLPQEIRRTTREDLQFSVHLNQLENWLRNPQNLQNTAKTKEKFWSVFFPEAMGLQENPEQQEKALRKKREIKITRLNPHPISNPAEEILFTANALFTIPLKPKNFGAHGIDEEIRRKLDNISDSPQLFWYDHPIPIGILPEANEVLYGLKGLDRMIAFEREKGNLRKSGKLTCVLSLSVTHRHLHEIAKEYLQKEISKSGGFKNLQIFVFTEQDTDRIVTKLLLPAARRHLGRKVKKKQLKVFGIDGEYGRHYSFLKAIAAFWSVFVDQKKKATFKIDLDQIFPQEQLVEQTNESALEHFKSPLWGAEGIDYWGRPVELGMIAGALVNQKDIHKSLFTPDVPYPDHKIAPDEYVFFSRLPQALSTRVEMMTRYNRHRLDGKTTCIQRIHVTGGTNGILVQALRRHHPFTPTFIGRAEDQAYLLSVIENPGPQLAYVHKPGLIMRHDKAGFAQEAMKASRAGKMVGDYIRILYFSEYARTLNPDYRKIKERVDPFTGCFISKIPLTVVYLRFALQVLSLIERGKNEQADEFASSGAERIRKAIHFTTGEEDPLGKQFKHEHECWHLFYDILAAVEDSAKKGEPFAKKLSEEANTIIQQLKIG